MITSDRQLKASKAQLELLKNGSSKKNNIAPEFRKAASIQLNAKVQELSAAIARYEDLRERGVAAIKIGSLATILTLPIEFRIAKRMTQEAFSEFVDIPLRQIARYEKSEYREINGENLAKILGKLSSSFRLEGRVTELP